jgi:general secretion pathway protein A
MYTSFFGLNEKPFSITPDPRYLYMSERHGEALAHLVYGVTESGGFMQLTGEVGTGKTTLVRTLLASRLPANADVAVVLNPQLSALEFLETIAEELGIREPQEKGSIKALIDALNRYLLVAHADGRRTILVVDEAQNLARDVLEEVRLLTNLETSKQKLLQIILIGQPELRDLLSRTDLRQLAQRITGRYHLQPLSRDETAQYIEHRLQVAGGLADIFDAGAKREVYKLSQGVPRIINVICDRALLGAYSREMRRVTRRVVRRAHAEVAGRAYVAPWLRWATPLMIVTGVAMLAFGIWSLYNERQSATAAPSTAAGALDPAADSSGKPVVITSKQAAAAEPGADASLDEQLSFASELTSTAVAQATLFELWGLPLDGDSNSACRQVQTTGFACVSQRGSWKNLRLLDRPAILTLTDSRGNVHRAVLTAINGANADLSLGGVSVSHPIAVISERWFGQYQFIWKPPNGISGQLRLGSREKNVVWLRESLVAIDERYRAEPMDSPDFDAGLENSVREFQRDHRLVVDGLAGRQTQIIINSLLAPANVPRLTTPRLAQD